MAYIVDNADAKAMAVHHEFTPCVDTIKDQLKHIPPENYIVVDQPKDGYREYESLLDGAPDNEPDAAGSPSDTWILIYTSGTTGKPKGVVRSHESHIAFFLINAVDFGFDRARRVHERHAPVPHQLHFFHLHLHLYRRHGLYSPGPVLQAR